MKVKIKTADNFVLDAVYNVPRHRKKTVVFAHGLTVSKDEEGIFVRAEKSLNRRGTATLRFDFRAHGESTGNTVSDFTISGALKDLEAVFNFLKLRGDEDIGLAGASFGGGSAALYAGKNSAKISSLFLANPALDYERCYLKPTTAWAREHYANLFERLAKDGFIPVGSRQVKYGQKLFSGMKGFNPGVQLKNYRGLLFMVQGDNDSKVDYHDTLACFESLPNCKKEIRILQGCEHGFLKEPYETQVVKMIVDFFN